MLSVVVTSNLFLRSSFLSAKTKQKTTIDLVELYHNSHQVPEQKVLEKISKKLFRILSQHTVFVKTSLKNFKNFF